jgi:hypothetical protein
MHARKPERYPLGSRARWLVSMVLLPLPILAVWIILRSIVPEAPLLVMLWVIWVIPVFAGLLWYGFDSKLNRDWHVPWFSDINAGLAYGSAEEKGIYFRKWFRRHFVKWKSIERVEFWPEYGGRVDLYLFNRWAPVVFAQHSKSDETVAYISRKLEETWPGHSTFLICIGKPPDKDAGFVSKITSTVGMGRNVVYMVMIALLVAFQEAVESLSYDHDFPSDWHRKMLRGAVAVLAGVVLVVWIAETLSRRARTDATKGAIPKAKRQLHD